MGLRVPTRLQSPSCSGCSGAEVAENICLPLNSRPSQLFRRRMQNYATLCDTIIQYYATLYNPLRYIAAYSRPYRRELLFLRR